MTPCIVLTVGGPGERLGQIIEERGTPDPLDWASGHEYLVRVDGREMWWPGSYVISCATLAEAQERLSEIRQAARRARRYA